MSKNMVWNQEKDIFFLANALKAGNVALGTSDTVLGFLADTTLQGKLALNEIKGREKKPYIILAESSLKISYFIDDSDLVRHEKLLKACWPGPLTAIFKAKDYLPDYLKGQDGTVAIRVPQHAGLLSLLGHFNGLFSTSANKAGQPVPHSLEEVDPAILAAVSYIITQDSTDTKPYLPSTILDLTGSTPKMIREGAIPKAHIEKIIGYSMG